MRFSSCRYFIDCTAAVRPERYSNVAKRDTLGRRHHLSSQHPGAPKQVARPLKPKQRAVARDTVSPRTSPTTPTLSASPCRHSRNLRSLRAALAVASVVAKQAFGQAPPLGRMLRVWLARDLANVQKRTQLQDLQRVHGGRTDSWLESHGSLMVLHQPGVKLAKSRVWNLRGPLSWRPLSF